jgi:hypothetical protein
MIHWRHCWIMKFGFFLFGLWDYRQFWPIVPASGDNEDDCGEHDGMSIGRGNRSSRRKPAPAPLLSITKSHVPTRVWTRAAEVGSRRLTAWAMARPWSLVTYTCRFERLKRCLGDPSKQRDTKSVSRRHFSTVVYARPDSIENDVRGGHLVYCVRLDSKQTTSQCGENKVNNLEHK